MPLRRAPAATPSPRLIADKMRVSLGRSVVVENKPDAADIIANMAVKAVAHDRETHET